MRASEKCRCHVIEIRFNYFLLGGETVGWGKANTVIGGGDEVPACLGSPSISGPGRWWGHYNRIGHAGTTLGGGATIIYELQLPSTPAPQSRNKVTKEGGGIHCPHLPPPPPPARPIFSPILPDSPWFYPCPPGYRGSALLIGGPWVPG